LINAEEKIFLDDVYLQDDSLYLGMHIFDAAIVGKIKGNKIEGKWVKFGYEPEYYLPLSAEKDIEYRFELPKEAPQTDFSGKWEVIFTKANGNTYPALGVFNQQGNEIIATFMTKTGDYRYLQGVVEGKTMKLSTFDGEHAFLFIAQEGGNGILKGDFYSGKTGHYTWEAKRNENFELPDAESLTFLKEGYETVEFSFPNLEGNIISLSDAKYKDKVVILQIFGSWCPNCMDETKFLAPWYAKNKERGVEIIGLAYERSSEFEKARESVQRMLDKYGIQYDFVIAGTNDKESASNSLPMLNTVMSFPTTIFIDKAGIVRKIHTGFRGPGTGDYYYEFVEEFNLFMDKLLKE